MRVRHARRPAAGAPRTGGAGRLLLVAAWLVLLAGCANHPPQPGSVFQRGKASYYSDALAGRRTASGEIYRPSRLTAAHKRLAFGSRVRVTNRLNGRSVVVRINDRGPFAGGRVIDLSRAAARRLHMIGHGVVPTTLELVRTPPAR
ncbi:septal ring lytic transglycosylase RlpA family protein [Salinisphaera sp. Q1T1-3]|uniref:septal ring lytic transglycosylase RlpA family protein n=1 Tax=Salinisphaera sp. Q1T1-3 TaxID=2321229 RepID=UPI0018F5C8AF|nr:septal ring lytic transglycosylase RlpA family protein [Salinisphaera sp. Q1T1-3]